MIYKAAEYKNGYILAPSSTDNDLQKLFKKYDNNIKCVICNSNTAKNFNTQYGYSIISINNKIADGCFFINNTF